MKVLTIILTLGLLVFLGHEAVTLQKLTVCRQEAWRSSLRLHTRFLLSKSLPVESEPLPKCRILVSRMKRKVHWKRFPKAQTHAVSLNLQGKL